MQHRVMSLALCGLMALGNPVLARTKAIADAKPSHDIIWGQQTTLHPPGGAMGRYPRLLKIRTGVHAGDILLSYQTEQHTGDFMLYRSSDNGKTWADPVVANKKAGDWDYASCNIIQLSDGRLLMTMQRRIHGSNLGKDYYIDVKYSSDGGESWGPPQQVFQGANWEARPFEVPHDENGDGKNDIYIFFTQFVIDTQTAVNKAARGRGYGMAVAVIASYDGGATWQDRNDERFSGQIIHRDFAEGPKTQPTDKSAGGMPQPFLLPDKRVGFVVEELGKKESPLVIANDPGDWDWTGKPFQGPWTSADYDGINDNNTYPLPRTNTWAAQKIEFSKAPYASVLADGRVIMVSQTPQIIRVWVGDKTAHDFKPQELPFGKDEAVFPVIEPISDTQILVAGGSYEPGDNFIYLRLGTVK